MARTVTAPLLPLPIEGARVRIDPVPGGPPGAATLVRIADGAPVGAVHLEAHSDALVIHELAIASEHRGYGLGSEAAALLRDAAAAAGWPLLRAWAPPHLGLAVYFWCRMGLRPLHGEGPDGGISFERRLP
jgi:GNAT superfamily N-acetyltransferase